MYATVIVDIANGAVDRGFCYRVPEGLTVALGQHVLVPFGYCRLSECCVRLLLLLSFWVLRK